MPHFQVKTYGDEYNLSVAFRVFENMETENPKRHLTGHTLNFKITIACHDIDENLEVMSSFSWLEDWLFTRWRNTVIVDVADPYLDEFRNMEKLDLLKLFEVDGTGVHAFAKAVLSYGSIYIKRNTDNRCWIASVECTVGNETGVYMGDI